MEAEIQNDQELYSYFRDRNTTLCRENFTFLMEHPEVKRLLNDYLSNILLHKPDDVFKFTKNYFKVLSSKGESEKFVILVGPNSVGKTSLITKLIEEYPDKFSVPKYTCTGVRENAIIITKENFMDLINKNMLLTYTYNNNDKEYTGLTLAEVERIQQEGKIAILEIDLQGALKISLTDTGANFIGILPPSMDALRVRIKEHTKLNTAAINKELEKAEGEVKEIETHSFFGFRIMNDEFNTGYRDFKNAIISLYPFLKYSDEDIEKLKQIQGRNNGEDGPESKSVKNEDDDYIHEEKSVHSKSHKSSHSKSSSRSVKEGDKSSNKGDVGES
jgi:guanylate kinase